MPRVGPIKRKDLIYYFRRLGWQGPYSGKKHQFMIRPGAAPLNIPNPHEGDIGRDLLVRILKRANIEPSTWEKL